MRELPAGTVTFLFTDIEGSTRLVQRLGEGVRPVLEDHARLLRGIFSRAGGIEVAERGDGFFFVFTSAVEALKAAAEAQRALQAHPWPENGRVRVRMGLHTGEGLRGGDNYMGLDVHRAARIASAGHGSQVVLSAASAELARGGLPADLSLRDLGRHRLKDLPHPEQLFQLVAADLPADFPPPRSLGSAPVNLPRPLTSFVGRRRELEQVIKALDEAVLVTLTGPGGTGKTRLALQVAAEAAGHYADGVFFVALGALSDPGLLAPTVLSTLGLPEAAGDPATILGEHLKPRSLLLVLDNFEQILDAGPQVAGWLREAPGLRVVVTSRAPLHLSGEREYAVPPLEVPDRGSARDMAELARNEAVQLFVARAAAARPDFALSATNAAAVAEITARVDGLPLAIELAAARVKSFPLGSILSRLSSRLSFLAEGARDLPARQQTLRAAISWSYDLLSPPARRLFRRLAVFVGGVSLAEAELVCGPAEELGIDVLDGLAVLVDHSLVRRQGRGEEPRFTMLETIREFAHGQLAESGELELIEERQAAAFLALAEEIEPRLTRRGRSAWLDRLEEDIGNLRSVLSRAVEQGQAERAQRLAGSLWRFWQTRGHVREGRERTAAALGLGGGGPARVRALWAAGGMAYWQADMDAAASPYFEALELARRYGEPRMVALSLYNAAFPLGFSGRSSEALDYLEEALAIARGLGDRELIGEILWGMGTVSWSVGDYAAAEPRYDEALQALAGSEAVFVIGWSHRQRGVLRLGRGDLAGSRADLEESLVRFFEDGDVPAVALHLRDFADLAIALGDRERALRLAGAATALQAASETSILEFAQNVVSGLEQAAAELGRERAEALLAEGRAMAMPQAVAYAREE